MAGVGLGQLLLALDATLVSLVDAPRGLDLPVASVALIDSDDVRLGLAAAAGSADVFFLLGITDDEAQRWVDKQVRERVPVAIFVKEPSNALVAKAAAAGSAVVAADPRARWERLYQLVNHVLEHHGDRADAMDDSGTDLFGLAQSLAERIHGMVSIENAQSHVLAYSASSDEADELRRLSILGRAGPPEHLEWIGQWGIFDALRSGGDVVRVAERPELGLRPRLAAGVYQPAPDPRRPPVFAGTIWVQKGSQPLADDAEEMVRGAAVLAARIMSRLSARPSTHARRVQQLLGLADAEALAPVDLAAVAHELGLAADGDAALIAWDAADSSPRHARLADVIALSASAFRHDAQVASSGARTYVFVPQTHNRAVTSWVRGTIGAMRAELGQPKAIVPAAEARFGVERGPLAFAFEPPTMVRPDSESAAHVPPDFLDLAKKVACHRAPGRWELLYRVLWRLTHGERGLLDVAPDGDVLSLRRMEKQVTRDAHKAKAFVRFRRVAEGDMEQHVAWHRPDHRILPLVAPFFTFSPMERTLPQ